MVKYLGILALCISSLAGNSQTFPSEYWHAGEVVTIEGDTLRGQIKYDLDTDIIQFSLDNKNTAQAFTARKLLYFEILDKTSNRYRYFYALPFNVSGGYNAPIFFELLHEGRHLTLLTRETIEYKVTNYPYSMGGSYTRLQLVYNYYFLTEKGKIESFSGKKRDLMHVLSKKSSEIKKFIKTNHLRVERKRDLVKIVDYYNSLFSNE